MAQSNYELVFYGQLVQGIALQQAKDNVALLFKTTAEQVERMFTGQRVVIRNKLDAETAQKYIIAMEKRGAICQLEIMGKPGEKVEPDTSTQAPETPAHVSAPTASGKPDSSISTKPKTLNPSGLPIAGDQTDTILAATHFELDPVGIRLSEEHQVIAPDFPHIDELSLAPKGSDLVDKKEQPPVAEPDISHLSLKPESMS